MSSLPSKQCAYCSMRFVKPEANTALTFSSSPFAPFVLQLAQVKCSIVVCLVNSPGLGLQLFLLCFCITGSANSGALTSCTSAVLTQVLSLLGTLGKIDLRLLEVISLVFKLSTNCPPSMGMETFFIVSFQAQVSALLV